MCVEEGRQVFVQLGLYLCRQFVIHFDRSVQVRGGSLPEVMQMMKICRVSFCDIAVCHALLDSSSNISWGFVYRTKTQKQMLSVSPDSCTERHEVKVAFFNGRSWSCKTFFFFFSFVSFWLFPFVFVFLTDTRGAGGWLWLWTGGLWHSQQDQCADWRWPAHCWAECSGEWVPPPFPYFSENSMFLCCKEIQIKAMCIWLG